MLGMLLSILSGALMSIQGVFNTEVTKQSGIWTASGFVQFTALLVCIGAWFVTGRQGNVASIFAVDKKYMLLGGAMGAFITYTVIKGVEMLGPAKAIMFIVVSQLIVAYLIELFGLFGQEKAPFDFSKLIGMALMIGGIVVFKWK